METGILSRIRQIIEYYSLSERQFAITIGIGQPALNTMFRRNQDDVKLTTIVKIINAFPEVNIDWLVMGRGEMIVRKEYPTSEEGSVPEMREELAIYRKTLNNLNDIVERQNRRMDELELQVKNKQGVAVNSDVVK